MFQDELLSKSQEKIKSPETEEKMEYLNVYSGLEPEQIAIKDGLRNYLKSDCFNSEKGAVNFAIDYLEKHNLDSKLNEKLKFIAIKEVIERGYYTNFKEAIEKFNFSDEDIERIILSAFDEMIRKNRFDRVKDFISYFSKNHPELLEQSQIACKEIIDNEVLELIDKDYTGVKIFIRFQSIYREIFNETENGDEEYIEKLKIQEKEARLKGMEYIKESINILEKIKKTMKGLKDEEKMIITKTLKQEAHAILNSYHETLQEDEKILVKKFKAEGKDEEEILNLSLTNLIIKFIDDIEDILLDLEIKFNQKEFEQREFVHRKFSNIENGISVECDENCSDRALKNINNNAILFANELVKKYKKDFQELLKNYKYEKDWRKVNESRYSDGYENNDGKIGDKILKHIEDKKLDTPNILIAEGINAKKILFDSKFYEKMENIDENTVLIIFQLPKKLAKNWDKGGEGNIVKDSKGVIEWGKFYRKLMDVPWAIHGKYCNEKNITLERINDIGDHDPEKYYYIWNCKEIKKQEKQKINKKINKKKLIGERRLIKSDDFDISVVNVVKKRN